MFSKFFQNSEWMNVFAVATMVVFIVAFAIIVIWVMKMDKNEIEEQRNLPLKD